MKSRSTMLEVTFAPSKFSDYVQKLSVEDCVVTVFCRGLFNFKFKSEPESCRG